MVFARAHIWMRTREFFDAEKKERKNERNQNYDVWSQNNEIAINNRRFCSFALQTNIYVYLRSHFLEIQLKNKLNWTVFVFIGFFSLIRSHY